MSASDDGGKTTQAPAQSTALVVAPANNVISLERLQRAREARQHSLLKTQWALIREQQREIEKRVEMLNEIVDYRVKIKGAGETPCA